MTQDTTPQTHYVTVAEVAEDLRITPMTVYRMISRGQITAIRIGLRTYRIPAESYADYKRQLHAAAEARAAGAPAPIPGQTEILTA